MATKSEPQVSLKQFDLGPYKFDEWHTGGGCLSLMWFDGNDIQLLITNEGLEEIESADEIVDVGYSIDSDEGPDACVFYRGPLKGLTKEMLDVAYNIASGGIL